MLHSLLSGLPDVYDEETRDKVLETRVLMSPIVERAKKDLPVPEHAPGNRPTPAVNDATTNTTSEDRRASEETAPKKDERFVGGPSVAPGAATQDVPDEDSGVGASEDSIEATPLLVELNNAPLFIPPTATLDEPELPEPRANHLRVGLCSLLVRADELYAQYPPSTHELCISEIFGQNSVVSTWSEDPIMLPKPDVAEAMVEQPDLIALGYTESLPTDMEEKEEVSEKLARRSRRRLRKRGLNMERGLVLATAVLVVGVAVAYGMRGSSIASRERHELRRLGGWLVGGLLGVGEKLLEGVQGIP